ncbi:MAG: hypothetical protein HY657_04855 [Acidobacteria bacterium]|nr:hypothetical protein [Acidobacteriota bacterium]
MERLTCGVIGGLAATLALAVAGPALAQVDLSGTWTNLIHEDGQPYRIGGPNIGDYTGHPLNEAGRARANTWSASRETVPEFQCIPHPATYWQNAGNVRIFPVVDDVTKGVVALHMEIHFFRSARDIWLDGRPRPPADARHTWSGFSTGEWKGNMLTMTTTHLKEGRVSRNGIEHSDRAVLVEHIFRHRDHLTWVSVIQDPVYFEEPVIKTRTYFLNLGLQLAPYPCVAAVEIDRPEGAIPHWLPGQNASLFDWAKRWGVPVEAAMGGARTLLPEFRKEIGRASGQ